MHALTMALLDVHPWTANHHDYTSLIYSDATKKYSTSEIIVDFKMDDPNTEVDHMWHYWSNC